MGFSGMITVAVGALAALPPAISLVTKAISVLKNQVTVAGTAIGVTGGQIGLMIAAAGALAGAVTALWSHFSKAKKEVKDYNGTMLECVNEIESLRKQHALAIETLGAESEQAKALADDLETLKAQYEKAGGAAAEYAEKAEKFYDYKSGVDEKIKEQEKLKDHAQMAAMQLQEISAKAQVTSADLKMMGEAADFLNDTFKCNIEVDYNTGDIKGFNYQSIIDEAEENKRAVARDSLTGEDYRQEYIDAYNDELKALQELQRAENKINSREYSRSKYAASLGSFNQKEYDFVRAADADYAEALEAYEIAKKTLSDVELEGKSLAIDAGMPDFFEKYSKYLNTSAAQTQTWKDNIIKLASETEKTVGDGLFQKTTGGGMPVDQLGFKGGLAAYVAAVKDGMGIANEETSTAQDAISEYMAGVSGELMKAAEIYDATYQACSESFTKQFDIFDEAGNAAHSMAESYNKANGTLNAYA